MADALDQMLEPGEQVVWRDPKRWLPPIRWAWLVHSAVMFPTMWAAMSGWTGIGSWTVLFGVFLLLGVFVSVTWWWCGYVVQPPTETVLTERRILHWNGWWIAPPDGVPLSGICAMDTDVSGHVLLTKRDGSKFEIRALRQPMDLAAHLQEAGKLPKRSPIGRLAQIGESFEPLCRSACFLLAVVFFGEALGLRGISEELASQILQSVKILALFFVAEWLGRHLGYLLGLAVLRPWVAAEEVANWFRAEAPVKSGGVLNALFAQPSGLTLWLAGRLYGQSFTLENGGGEANG